jgi:glutaminyl-tRNA synthetase
MSTTASTLSVATQPSETPAAEPVNNFIRHIIHADNASGKHAGAVVTRFPPEPNGYLHLGHAKSICLNFGLARDFVGRCNLRFDDTNPSKEEQEYVDAIKADVEWLGFTWTELRHASDYFEVFYLSAEKLIRDGLAFVCDLSAEDVRAYRGTLTEPGRPSPQRDRSVAENLALFRRMRAGDFDDGACTLRAKIDMASGNINLRDPALYRIRKVVHQNTGSAWCIYPMYDYAHCLSDALEGITHSICTVEFEDHRPLYDWCVAKVDLANHPELYAGLQAAGFNTQVRTPQQIEFARGNVSYTVLSKRKLIELVTQNLVHGWDDPRMPTLSGVRRRGFPALALRNFWERAGVSKQVSVIDMAVLEGCVREVLDVSAERRMAVLRPLKVVISNLAAEHSETLRIANHPKDASLGERDVRFTQTLYIEHDDFMEAPIKGFHRLVPGGEVRLRGVGMLKCDAVEKTPSGETVLHASLDSTTRHGMPGAERKVKGTIHWVSATENCACEVRLYDRLFTQADPDQGADGQPGDFRANINPASEEIITAMLELDLARAQPEQTFQFERLGYFCADRIDAKAGQPVFNRVVGLRDTWQAQR